MLPPLMALADRRRAAFTARLPHRLEASIAQSAADAANAAVVAAHLVAAITSSERSTAHERGDVVFGGFLQPPSNGFINDHWALITALTP